mmetsp:Transcript_68674/g.108949  ORF Transcript_68674/g.108949 Transcript_68674/m.108949 type:complete len:86 (+) Transcript_68674:509-766(+)
MPTTELSTAQHADWRALSKRPLTQGDACAASVNKAACSLVVHSTGVHVFACFPTATTLGNEMTGRRILSSATTSAKAIVAPPSLV